MDVGKITNVEVVGGEVICTVDFGSDFVEVCTLHGAAGMAEIPVTGDEVTVDMKNNENVIVAMFRPSPDGIGSGDKWLFGRDSNGNIKSSVKLKNDGTVVINDGTEPAIKGASLNDYFTQTFSVATAFGPSGQVITPIPDNCFNRTVLI